ncbi:MAG: hypothetical protein QY332_13290 [Anaerolineales bacterium]|nr:MAG: hypothetical protein QY332_13290 [Anaerolineales bacterium]
MQPEKFSIPEFTATAAHASNKEEAIRKVRRELNGVFLLAAGLVVYFIFSCYATLSTTSLLIYLGVSAAGLYGLWRFHKRVEGNEIRRIEERKPFIRPSEDLEIDSEGIHWRRSEPQPDRFDIAWHEIKSISFGSFGDASITLSNGQKLKTPLIMNQYHNQIAVHIEYYTKLKKSVTERYYRDEKLEDILYD